MANALYAKGKEKILSAEINFTTDTIKAALVSTAYTPNLATDEFLSTISAYVLGTPQTLSGKTTTAGAFDANDPTFPTVAAGSTAKYVVVYKETGTPATSPLLVIDDSVTGFPFTTTGSDVTVQWDNSTLRIFSL